MRKIADKVTSSKAFIFVKYLVEQYFGNAVGRTAAELAYFLLFTLFPIVIFLNAIIGSFNFSHERLTQILSSILPNAVSDVIISYFQYLTSIDSSGFVWLGIVLTVYSIYRVVNAVFYALNKNYVTTKRYAIRRMLVAILFAVALVVAVLLSIVLISTGDWFITWLGGVINISFWLTKAWQLLRIVIMAGMFFFTMLIAYWLAPSERIKLRDAIWGTVFAMVGMTVLTMWFSFYVDNLSRYPLLYGSLGTMLLLMLWLYLMGNVIVLGGEVNFVLAKMKKKKEN